MTLTLYFINSGIEFYEDLSDYKKFLTESEENFAGPDFFILASLLRLWRKNFNLLFLPVEFLDFLILNYKSELISDTVNFIIFTFQKAINGNHTFIHFLNILFINNFNLVYLEKKSTFK